MFEVQLVNSTAIRLISYNAESNTLRIIFRNGSAYDYANVSQSVFEELACAESVGRFFSQIRNTLKYRRLQPIEAQDFLLRVLEAAQDQRIHVAA